MKCVLAGEKPLALVHRLDRYPNMPYTPLPFPIHTCAMPYRVPAAPAYCMLASSSLLGSLASICPPLTAPFSLYTPLAFPSSVWAGCVRLSGGIVLSEKQTLSVCGLRGALRP